MVGLTTPGAFYDLGAGIAELDGSYVAVSTAVYESYNVKVYWRLTDTGAVAATQALEVPAGPGACSWVFTPGYTDVEVIPDQSGLYVRGSNVIEEGFRGYAIRYSPEGILDTAFGEGGCVETDQHDYSGTPEITAVDSTGRLFVTHDPPAEPGGVRRFTTDGALDGS